MKEIERAYYHNLFTECYIFCIWVGEQAVRNQIPVPVMVFRDDEIGEKEVTEVTLKEAVELITEYVKLNPFDPTSV